MKKKWTIIVPAVVCVMLAVCACGKKDDTLQFTGDTKQTPPYQDNLNMITPAAYNNVQGIHLKPGAYISIIGKDSSSAYWKEVKRGVDQAAKDLNGELGYSGDKKIKVTYNAPSSSEDIDEQVNILDEELARYPDAVGIASIDASAGTIQFDLATENGIPIIALDSGNAYQGIQCTVETNNAEAAKTGAAKLCDGIHDKGSILLVVPDSMSESSKQRVSSFENEIKTNHPNVTIGGTLYMDKMAGLKKSIAEEKDKAKKDDDKGITPDSLSDADVIAYYLEKHPDINGCFGTNVTATQAILAGLQKTTAKKKDDVVLMGFDAGKDQVQALKDGKIKGLVIQNPFGIGYASVIAASRTILGSGNEAVVDTGYVWVTKGNMKDKSIKNMLYE